MKTRIEGKRTISGLCAVLVTFLSLTIHGAPTTEGLKIGISQEFETFNPLVTSMSAALYVNQMVSRALVTIDETGKWVPQMAKKIPTLADGSAKLTADKKKLVAVWEIKDEVTWGDGVPLTCADFAFAREVGNSENVSVPRKDIYTMIEKIEWDLKTPKKCSFTYQKARWDFYQIADFRPIPKHIEEPIFNQHKSQSQAYERNTAYNRNPTLPGLYSGPYLVSEVKLADYVTMVPNPKYFGEKPKFKKIQIKLIPDTGALEANLRSNTIDQIASIGLTLDQALAFEKRIKAEKLPYNVSIRPSTFYEHINLNLDNPILKDLRVRKAMAYAIDRQQLVSALFENRQEVAVHSIAPIDPWFTKDPKKITLYPYNKKLAVKLLEEAGWKLGADGIRQKDGQRLRLPFTTTSGDKVRESVQAFLQNQWKAVGIDVQIKNTPAKVFFGDVLKTRSFEGIVMYALSSSPESTPKSNLHSTMIPSTANNWSGKNRMGYSNKKVDSLLEQLDLEFDAEKRKNIVAEIMHYYTEDVPAIPLYFRSNISVEPSNMTGFKLMGHQYYETNNVEFWNLKQ